MRLGIRGALEGEKDVELVAEASSGKEGLEKFEAQKPDVALVSLRMPETCAVDDLDSYFTLDDRARIIVIADHAGDAEITASLRKGALGYVCTDVDSGELVRAIRVVGSGRKFIPEHIAAIVSESLGSEDLTKAEHRVLEMLVGGMSNKEIGFALDISENTVKTHVKNVFGKLGVSDRTSATTTAIRRGIVRIDV